MNREIAEMAKAIGLPRMEEIITEDYVRRVLETGKFVGHGSDDSLRELFMEHADVDGWPSPKNKDDLWSFFFDIPEDIVEERLRHWLPLRYEYVVRDMANDLENVTEIHRALQLTKLELEDLLAFPGPVGVFWSTRDDCSPWGAKSGGKETVDVTLTTRYDPALVDWRQTMFSRFDFQNGDHEMEIRLKPESPLGKVTLVTEDGEEIPIEVDKTA